MFWRMSEHSQGNEPNKIHHQQWKRQVCRQLNFNISDLQRSRRWKRLRHNSEFNAVCRKHSIRSFPVSSSDRSQDLTRRLNRNTTNSQKHVHGSLQLEIQRFSTREKARPSSTGAEMNIHQEVYKRQFQRNRSSPLLAVLLVTLLSASHVSLAAPRSGGRDTKADSGDGTRDVMDLRCPPCPQILCPVSNPRQLGCKGGITTGVCGCCPACARLSGERCGGDLTYLGKCDQGLTCVTVPTSPSIPTYRMQREPPGICTKGAVGATEQADEAFTQKCRPQCTQQFCSKKPRAVCSASNGIAKIMRPCQGKCQHTSCRACAMVNDVGCVRCTSRDFRCLKQFGRCVARKTCRGKAGRKFCRRLKIKGNIPRRFVCQVPDCPS